jgi:hypothetical protein
VLTSLAPALEQTLGSLQSAGAIDLSGDDVTRAILMRMAHFYRAQNATKKILAKRYMSAGADFFAEAVLFWLRAVLDTHGSSLLAEGERTVEQKRGALRPDISVWDGDECVAFIECKTQLGWARHRWEADFAQRQLRIEERHIGARGFLVVMTSENLGRLRRQPEAGDRLLPPSRPVAGEDSR